MKKKVLSVLFILALGGSLFAQFSFNLGATSDYVWRGVTQTEGDPALQGGIDWDHASGFYLGGWASNISFDGESDIEVDFYGGILVPLPNDVELDLGYMRYEYMDSDAEDEVYAGLSWKDIEVKYARGFEVNWHYLEGNLALPLPSDFELGLHFGRFDFDDDEDYNEWKATVARPWKGFDFELAFTDTDLGIEGADARASFTVMKTW